MSRGKKNVYANTENTVPYRLLIEAEARKAHSMRWAAILQRGARRYVVAAGVHRAGAAASVPRLLEQWDPGAFVSAMIGWHYLAPLLIEDTRRCKDPLDAANKRHEALVSLITHQCGDPPVPGVHRFELLAAVHRLPTGLVDYALHVRQFVLTKRLFDDFFRFWYLFRLPFFRRAAFETVREQFLRDVQAFFDQKEGELNDAMVRLIGECNTWFDRVSFKARRAGAAKS
ncbi:MAG: hypothetical protein NZM12_10300 [Steroidobacteraceae bacterium]|nr:hypothetical protein [Steroidobacteraceae bacterium]MDW8259981.1 hypothetical protein [Gammaproteobacteria bacterium]